MFGHKSKPSRIYQYGCLQPTTGLDDVLDQMFRAHCYRNAMVEAELNRRKAYHAAMKKVSPGIAALYEAIETAEEARERLAKELKRKRSSVHFRRHASEGPKQTYKEVEAEVQESQLQLELKQLGTLLKEQRAKLKERRASARGLDKVLEGLEAEAHAKALALRAEHSGNGLYWGNYLSVEQAAKSFKQGAPPRFHRADGTGRIVLQFQGGLPVGDAIDGEDSRLRIVMNGQSAGGRRQFAECWFRTGSDETGKPKWAIVPFVYHRDLPADTDIKWAYLHRQRTGTRWKWALSFVLSKDEWPKEDCASKGTVAISVGWKITGDKGKRQHLQVAEWVGDDGKEGKLLISADDIRRWIDPAELRAERDKRLNVVRDSLVAWLEGCSGAKRKLPDWLLEQTESLHQWRSARRLVALTRRWAEARFRGDDDIFGVLNTWRIADTRDYNSEEGQRSRAIRWRDDLYRNFVALLRANYRTAKIREVDYAELAERKEGKFVASKTGKKAVTMPDGEKAEITDSGANWNRVIAAPGRLVALIKEGFAKVELVARKRKSARGAVVPKMPSAARNQ